MEEIKFIDVFLSKSADKDFNSICLSLANNILKRVNKELNDTNKIIGIDNESDSLDRIFLVLENNEQTIKQVTIRMFNIIDRKKYIDFSITAYVYSEEESDRKDKKYLENIEWQKECYNKIINKMEEN